MRGSKAQLTVADYVLLAVTLTVSLAIGAYSGWSSRKRSSVNEYLLGGRKLKLLPVTASLVVSYISSLAILGLPAETYYYGFQVIFQPVGIAFWMVAIAIFYVPLVHPLRLISVFEYLEMRFESRQTRLLGMTLSVLSELAYAGIVLFGPALVVEAFFDVPTWMSLIGLATICTIYTALGGIRAVVWTDAFQALIIVVGLLAVLVMGTAKVGGVAAVMSHMREGGRLEFSFDPDPRQRGSVWLYGVAFPFYVAGLFTGQGTVQRLTSLPTVKQARLSLLIGCVAFCGLLVLGDVAGAVAYTYYSAMGCDPLAAGYITDANQIMPYFVNELLGYPGVPGIFIACLFSAVLSTVSSLQNGMAANIWKDLLSRRYNYLQERTKLLILKFIVVGIGGLVIVLGFLASSVKGTLIQLTSAISGSVLGPRLGMFVLASMVPFVGPVACCIGTLCGVVASLALTIVNIVDPPHWPMLHSSVKNCSHTNASRDAVANLTTTWTPLPMLTSNGMDVVDYNLPFESNKFYQISGYSYTVFGFVVTVTVSVLLSAIPAFRMKNRVPKKYLIICIGEKTEVADENQMDPLCHTSIEPKPNIKPNDSGDGENAPTVKCCSLYKGEEPVVPTELLDTD